MYWLFECNVAHEHNLAVIGNMIKRWSRAVWFPSCATSGANTRTKLRASCWHANPTRWNTSAFSCCIWLTLILLTWKIWWAPNNASRWQMGFNSAFKGLRVLTDWATHSSNLTPRNFLIQTGWYLVFILSTTLYDFEGRIRPATFTSTMVWNLTKIWYLPGYLWVPHQNNVNS